MSKSMSKSAHVFISKDIGPRKTLIASIPKKNS